MADYTIFTDCGSDLPQELRVSLRICSVPFTLTVGGESYYADDERGLDAGKFYAALRQGEKALTAGANPEGYALCFRQALVKGNDVLYLGFSSGLSGSVRNAVIAANDLREEFPERKVVVVDTLCGSLGLGMLCRLCAEKRDAGYTLEELTAYAEETKHRVCHWFTVGDLDYLKRTGRLSAATALVGGMLQIKPILHMDPEGKIVSVGKARGCGAALRQLLSEMNERADSVQTLYISHADCLADAESLAVMAREQGIAEVVIAPIGPVIGSHCGPDTLAIYFLGTER